MPRHARRLILARARLVTISAAIRSREIAPRPSQNGLYPDTNGSTAAAKPIVTYGSTIAVITWIARKATASSETLRCSPVTAKEGRPGRRPWRLTRRPSSSTTVSSSKVTTPVARLAYHSAVPCVMPVMAGAAAALGGPQFAAWSGGLLSVVSAVVTCLAIPQFWRYRSQAGPAPGASEAVTEPGAGQVAEG